MLSAQVSLPVYVIMTNVRLADLHTFELVQAHKPDKIGKKQKSTPLNLHLSFARSYLWLDASEINVV